MAYIYVCLPIALSRSHHYCSSYTLVGTLDSFSILNSSDAALIILLSCCPGPVRPHTSCSLIAAVHSLETKCLLAQRSCQKCKSLLLFQQEDEEEEEKDTSFAMPPTWVAPIQISPRGTYSLPFACLSANLSEHLGGLFISLKLPLQGVQGTAAKCRRSRHTLAIVLNACLCALSHPGREIPADTCTLFPAS